LKKNVDVRHTEQEKVSTQQYIVFLLWSSISSSYKSSDDKVGDDKVNDATGKEKLLQEKVTRSSSTKSLNTVSTLVNTVSASRTFIPPHDPLMPELEDTVEIQTTGIFSNAYDEDDLETNNHSYANESVGAAADFNNMEPSTVRDYKDIIEEFVQANVINEVKKFLPKFLPHAVKEALKKTPPSLGNPQQEMMDYGYNFMQTKIYVDNESAICVIKNHVYHSKTKHIEIRHHFIRDSYKKRLIEMVKIHTDNIVAYLLTKAFDVRRFNFLVASIVKTGLKIMYHQTEVCEKTDNLKNSKEVGTLRELVQVVVPGAKILYWGCSTIEDGVMAITATIDRNVKVLITEASIRRHLKLCDSEGLSILLTKEIFEQLALMGYVTTSDSLTFQKIHTNLFEQTPKILFPHTRTYPTPILTQKLFSNMKRASKGYSRVLTSLFDTMLVQHQHGELSTPETTPMPHDSPLQSVYLLGRDEGSLSLNELTVLCTSLSTKVQNQGKSEDTQVSGQPEEQLRVFSVAKVLADAAEQGRGKAVMQESEPTKKIKKKIQVEMSIDEELARKLHEEELARPRSVAEVRKSMCIYLKKQGGFKLSHFKGMSYADIRPIFEKVWDQIHSFVPMNSELEVQRSKRTVQEVERQSTKEEKGKKSNDSSKPTRKKTLARKRASGHDIEESKKKQKLEDEKLIWIEFQKKNLLWKSDGSSKNYKIFSEMLDDFDGQDVMDVHGLVKERYTTTSPEGYDLMLWGDLKTLFVPDEENKL
nr:putative ribonuclease H-like domain-containing protein [Tanacetum cinerariifolium]